MYNMTRKGIPFEWTEEHQRTFEELKKDKSNPSILSHQIIKDILP